MNYRLMAWRYCCGVTYCPPVSASIVLVGGELAKDDRDMTSVKTAVESYKCNKYNWSVVHYALVNNGVRNYN